jgi:hypothetical protein
MPSYFDNIAGCAGSAQVFLEISMKHTTMQRGLNFGQWMLCATIFVLLVIALAAYLSNAENFKAPPTRSHLRIL